MESLHLSFDEEDSVSDMLSLYYISSTPLCLVASVYLLEVPTLFVHCDAFLRLSDFNLPHKTHNHGEESTRQRRFSSPRSTDEFPLI